MYSVAQESTLTGDRAKERRILSGCSNQWIKFKLASHRNRQLHTRSSTCCEKQRERKRERERVAAQRRGQRWEHLHPNTSSSSVFTRQWIWEAFHRSTVGSLYFHHFECFFYNISAPSAPFMMFSTTCLHRYL
ncbi:hypothetical protein GDO81_014245 [Engystomops pustulosus]|uniref:Uncharacterized protein n=1 Tax=Engystomops pustulosus TaxID=76066 RepID=A0AAV7B934_ENGPU|nr:hypothetical protein GDO81_014245 [Engystomops pustulosus]